MIKLFYYRTFKVIPFGKAHDLGLTFKCNIYGDLINKINCRSIWIDSKGREYRVEGLYKTIEL